MNEKKLYHFLMENETRIFRERGEIQVWVHVDYDDLKEFSELLNIDGESNPEAILCTDTVFVDLTIKFYDLEIKEWKECFTKDEWENVFSEGEET